MQEGGREGGRLCGAGAVLTPHRNDLGKLTEPDNHQHHTATLKVLHLSQMSALIMRLDEGVNSADDKNVKPSVTLLVIYRIKHKTFIL